MTNVTRVVLAVDSSQVRRGTTALQGMQRSGTQAQRATASLGKSMSLLRSVLPIASMAGLVLTTKQLVRVFADFDRSMSRVKAVSRATETQFVLMREAAMELGATTEFTASQAASGLEFLARAGWSAEESVAALPGVLDLATASSMDLGRAADIASNIMSAFGFAAERSGDASDILAAASSRSNTTVEQLGEGMKMVGPIASALGISVGDTAAAIGVLSDSGIQATMAGTGLRRMLSKLVNPTAEGAREIRKLGLSLEDVDPRLHSVTDIMQLLASRGVGASEAFKIFGDLGGPAFSAIVQNNVKLAQLSEELRSVEGESKRMADTIRDDLTGDMQGLTSAIQATAIAIGEELEPSLRSATQTATGLTRSLASEVPTLLLTMRRVVALTTGAGLRGVLEEFFLDAEDGAESATEEVEKLGNALKALRPPPVEILTLIDPDDDRLNEARAIVEGTRTEVERLAAEISRTKQLMRGGFFADGAGEDVLQRQLASMRALRLEIPEIDLLPVKDPDDRRFNEASRFFESSRTEAERLRAEIERIKVLMEGGFFPEGGDEVLKRHNEMLDEALRTTESLGNDVTKAFAEQAGGAIEEMFARGEISAGNFAESVLRDIARIMAQLLIVRPLIASMFGDDGKSGILGGVISGFVSGLIPGAGGDSLQMIDTAALPQTRSFASGTDYAPGGMALVGERGPEKVFLPQGSKVIPNHAMQGGQEVTIIDQRGASSPPVQMQRSQNGGVEQIKVFIRDEIKSAIAEGGMDRALQSTGMVSRRRGMR